MPIDPSDQRTRHERRFKIPTTVAASVLGVPHAQIAEWYKEGNWLVVRGAPTDSSPQNNITTETTLSIATSFVPIKEQFFPDEPDEVFQSVQVQVEGTMLIFDLNLLEEQ